MKNEKKLWRDFSTNGFEVVKKWWKTNFWRVSLQPKQTRKMLGCWLTTATHMRTCQDRNHQNYEQMIAFCVKRSSKKDRFEALKIIAETNASSLLKHFTPYLKDIDMVTVLNRAADYKSWSVVQLLKDYDAPHSPINATLELAAGCGNLEVVQVLKDNASIHHVGKALSAASLAGHHAVVGCLLPYCTVEEIYPALVSALKRNHEQIVENLLPLLPIEELMSAKNHAMQKDASLIYERFPSESTMEIIDRYILRHTLEQQTANNGQTAPTSKRRM